MCKEKKELEAILWLMGLGFSITMGAPFIVSGGFVWGGFYFVNVLWSLVFQAVLISYDLAVSGKKECWNSVFGEHAAISLGMIMMAILVYTIVSQEYPHASAKAWLLWPFVINLGGLLIGGVTGNTASVLNLESAQKR
jgi:hypothetical protein